MLKLRLDRRKQILCVFILYFSSAVIRKERNVERQIIFLYCLKKCESYFPVCFHLR